MKLTPESSIEALERRFELGQTTYARIAWNAHANQEQLDNDHWIWNRIAHGIEHLKHFSDVRWNDLGDNGDDDGAAIMWLGCMLHEAYIRRKIRGSTHKGVPNPAEEVQATPVPKRPSLSGEKATGIKRPIREGKQTRERNNSSE